MKPGQLRCAIYTRVSTEYGLEQEFNSLDAQREACEAYVKSQAHEGWRALPTLYDDGGYSGGSMQRPALQALLAAIRDGGVDVVVVYKVDRLTRSLADFAKLVELFDKDEVSFVSVTQSFNTTNSMGRLTLNVLLSFAQFEREVTGERIRDKIAASKRKGLRVGGPVPLGYRVVDKKLVIDPEEAAQVREIFSRYLAIGSLSRLVDELRARDIVTKRTRKRDGSVRGGIAFTKGPLAFLLRNRVYIGEIIHKDRHYPGEHEPLLDRNLFDAVQARLSEQARALGAKRINEGSLLTGLLVDDRGNRMSPVTANKAGIRYRYYASAALTRGERSAAGSMARVPAPEIEAAVSAALVPLLAAQHHSISSDEREGEVHLKEPLRALVEKIILRSGALEIRLRSRAPNHTPEPIRLPFSPPRRIRRQIIGVTLPSPARPIHSGSRARLIEGIAKARRWVEDLTHGRAADTHAIAAHEGCSERSVRMGLNLAFLSPALVQAAIDGTLPYGWGLCRLADQPIAWNEQLGVSAP